MTVATLGEGLLLIRGDGVGSVTDLRAAAISTGGAEANVAIALARLGHPVRWLGRIGHDDAGRRVERELRAEGVEVRAIRDPDAPTALMLKTTPHAGTTDVAFWRAGSAGSRLEPQDLDPLEIEDAELLHLTGILPSLSPSALATAREAVERATAAAVPVSFDVNHRARLWDRREAVPVYRELAARARYVFGGVEELALLVDADHQDERTLAGAVAAFGPTEVVVKRGGAGAAALVDGAWNDCSAHRVEVIDTVGAGDAFVAGYLSERLRGRPVEDALGMATRNGAAVCAHPGDWEGALRAAEPAPGDRDDAVRR